jgi:hypothetical protein
MDTNFWDAISAFMTGILQVLNSLLVPMDGTGVVDWTLITPVQILIWFGLVFLFVGPLFGFIIRMIKSGSSG